MYLCPGANSISLQQKVLGLAHWCLIIISPFILMKYFITILHRWVICIEELPWWLSGKESALMQETWVQSLGWEHPLEEGMATHPSMLTRRIPWTEEHGGLQSIGSKRIRHDWSNLVNMHLHWMFCVWCLCVCICEEVSVCSPRGLAITRINPDVSNKRL